ncbi:hypothetical protein G4G28_07225 [Massilia sp. Dwa41.01b]|uniref:T6SS immunity protein Tli4 family protein n=1 Tax=unclassified Massilia TaxID=2609279 RepID=UPI0016031B5B|nr:MULTISPECIES: T6SS immunity protein Tli4 family protein [unclassified Massilia]QNA88346.1 hypothetical protein G4G28_07225 [Massilia sp. Dwa41.01b]QNA99245.1 hypothetical protein G4G31_10930 [Massilia sp. Se16.2.3]
MAQNMTHKMKSVCVGRFIIDLPEESIVKFAPARIAGVNINVEPGYTDAKMKSEIELREQELSLQKNEYDQPSLEKKNNVDALNFKAVIMHYAREKPVTWFELGKRISGAEEGISLEAFGLYDNLLFYYRAEHLASPKNENNVLNLVRKTEARNSDSIPPQPGFCMENGLIHDPISPDDNESIAMFASLKGHPDIAIRLHMLVNDDRVEESLLARDARSRIKRLYPNRIKNLRRQHRALNGIEGDETANKYKEDNGTSAHALMWFSPGKARDVLAPQLSLELETGIGRPGEPVNSSLSDEAVLELWDNITKSIRLRPTSATGQAGTVTVKHQVALGELAATGRRCPQTGYWQCDASGQIEDDQRQFLNQGDLMPKAIVRGTPNLWQKLSGDLPLHRVSTVWKLVAYDAAAVGKSATDGSGLPRQAPTASDSDDAAT